MTPTSRTGAKPPTERFAAAGFTLVEISLVVLLFAVSIVLVVPNLFRAGTGMDDFARFSLWTEVVLERAAFRREVVLIEIKPGERSFRLVQPRRVMPDAEAGAEATMGDEGTSEGVATLDDLQDPYIPGKFEWPSEMRLLDVQSADGTRYRDETLLVVVYPGGWIDPFSVHLRDAKGDEHTGFVNPITGRVRWVEGYRERVRQGDES
jgi:hypothetical protein